MNPISVRSSLSPWSKILYQQHYLLPTCTAMVSTIYLEYVGALVQHWMQHTLTLKDLFLQQRALEIMIPLGKVLMLLYLNF
jgi:hypothetical protein